jgi:DNA-binding LacI/PurR family transcriptional regulator
MRTTMKDVALQANVSIKTVSNVIHKRAARVSPATSARILQVIEELGYQPNPAARQLRKAETGILALAVPRLDNPYFASIARHVIDAGERRGRIVLVDHTYGEHERELKTVQGLRPGIIDGIIFDPQALAEGDIQGLSSHIPVVLIGEQLLAASFDHVLIDNEAAAKTATEHLIALGRKRIGVIGLDFAPGTQVQGLRMSGYVDALRSSDRAIDEALIVPSVTGLLDRQDGALAMQVLLDQDPKPDAVFCFNDMMAIGAMRLAHDRGIRIPEDIAFASIDGNEEGEFSVPSLTSVRPDSEALATLAVDLLIQRIENRRYEETQLHYVPFSLLIRESTIGES